MSGTEKLGHENLIERLKHADRLLVRGLKDLLDEKPDKWCLSASEILGNIQTEWDKSNITELCFAVCELCGVPQAAETGKFPSLWQVAKMLRLHKSIQSHRLGDGYWRFSVKSGALRVPDTDILARSAHRLATASDIGSTAGVDWDSLIPEHKDAWRDFVRALLSETAAEGGR